MGCDEVIQERASGRNATPLRGSASNYYRESPWPRVPVPDCLEGAEHTLTDLICATEAPASAG